MIHKKLVHVLLLSLIYTRNGSPVPCWTALISISKSRVWITKSEWRSNGESSASIRARVQTAQNIQRKRFTGGNSDIVCNADMRVGATQQFCKLQDEGQSLMRVAMTKHNLSACAYHCILKLARTIAHLAEALHASQSSEVDDGMINQVDSLNLQA